MKVPQMLADLTKIYEDRNALYGDKYKRVGQLMMEIIGPMEVKSADDYNRLNMFINMVTKLFRYGGNFPKEGHPDSLDDLSIYSQMLQEIDKDIYSKKIKEIGEAVKTQVTLNEHDLVGVTEYRAKGRIDCLNGKAFNENLYPHGSYAWKQWEIGFIETVPMIKIMKDWTD